MTQRKHVSAKEPSGLGGWLILTGITLIIAPLTMLYTLYTDFLPIFQEGIWQELTTPGHGGISPSLGTAADHRNQL